MSRTEASKESELQSSPGQLGRATDHSEQWARRVLLESKKTTMHPEKKFNRKKILFVLLLSPNVFGRFSRVKKKKKFSGGQP
jgi:hypothetical protein